MKDEDRDLNSFEGLSEAILNLEDGKRTLVVDNSTVVLMEVEGDAIGAILKIFDVSEDSHTTDRLGKVLPSTRVMTISNIPGVDISITVHTVPPQSIQVRADTFDIHNPLVRLTIAIMTAAGTPQQDCEGQF